MSATTSLTTGTTGSKMVVMKSTIQEWLKLILAPLAGIGSFILLWSTTATNISTSLGQFLKYATTTTCYIIIPVTQSPRDV